MQEKDIKVLEDYAYAMCTISCTTEKDKRIAQAIENLIKGYKELEEYKKYAELTKISCCTAQNCEALNNAIRDSLENNKLKEELEKKDNIIKSKDKEIKLLKEFHNKHIKIIDEMADMIVKDHEWFYSEFDNYTKKQFIEYFTKKVEKDVSSTE